MFTLSRGLLNHMKTKCLSALLATGAIALATPAVANSPDEPSLNFSCQVTEGVPTTVAQSTASEIQLPIFHWKQEALTSKSSDSPEQLCNIVSDKLENYVICANAGESECSKVLLTLHATSESEAAVVAKDVVNSILDKDLQLNKFESQARGVQSISYEVDFWSLFGLRPKFLSK